MSITLANRKTSTLRREKKHVWHFRGRRRPVRKACLYHSKKDNSLYFLNERDLIVHDADHYATYMGDWIFAKYKIKPQEERDSLEIEMELYEFKKEFYLKHYEGKYIALKNQEVIDFDTDFSELAKRVFEINGYESIFIPLVTRKNNFKSISPK